MPDKNPKDICAAYFLAIAIAAALTACGQIENGHVAGGDFGAAPATRDPEKLAAVLALTANPEETRKAADAALRTQGQPAKASRLAALVIVLENASDRASMRLYALDELSAADPQLAATTLARILPDLDADLVPHACEVAIKLADPHLVPALVESLDAASSDDAASPQSDPRWTTIETLANASPTLALRQIVTSAASPQRQRIAALDVWQRAAPASQIIPILAAVQNPDPWLSDLRWWSTTFAGLPIGSNEHTWIHELRRPENADLNRRAALRTNPVDGPPSPRFVGLLANADPAGIAMSRDQLLAALTTGPLRLNRFPHVRRAPSSPGAIDDVDNRLAANAEKLSRNDLLLLYTLAQSIENPATLREFERQGLADLADKASEHGGLLRFQNGKLMPQEYPPMFPAGDTEYIASDALLNDAPLGFALYHFHFHQLRNAEFAGPGAGDLQFARANRTNCIVITSIDKHQLDFQYFAPTGAVVDLGVRPIPQIPSVP